MTTAFLTQDIEREEGREHEAYPDPKSELGLACQRHGHPMRDYRKVPAWDGMKAAPWTIGVGQTGEGIHQGLRWTDTQIDAALRDSIACCAGVIGARYYWFSKLKDERQDVLVQMAFQMGVDGLAKFAGTLAAVKAGDYESAAAHMLDSAWAAQTPSRVKRLALQMKTGKRP